jgi:heat shock protein HslJ
MPSPRPLVPGYRITLVIGGAGAQGTAACNLYGGGVDIDGGSFSFRGGGMTEMA